ncbi:gluconate 2-dehydrogenase subunit 3 family protein [Modicisalibacter luteus]|uniref:Tat (Twin-arginine translocation) pathway signal sequence n=1 Tax=Modicisalibacter luteus TaxID=453962 RepID=A0ABV7M234_9GAMM|nr:tat (twin-arginine translocation) pathway signal sequence [Halomonas lutea]
MFSRPLSRRVFLKSSGGALVGTLAFATGSIALLAPSRSWAVTTELLTTHEGEVLLQFTRHVFPHRDLEDAVYALVVKDLDRQADTDPETLTLLRDGVTALDRQAGGDWLALDAAQRQASVAEAAGSAFFEKIRSSAVVSLYSNPLAFAHFGYQGEEGDMGYLFKGFDDLTWLPDPGVPDSGPIPGV